MSETSKAPKPVPAIETTGRRGFLKRSLGAASAVAIAAIFGRKPKTAEAQGVIVPIPGQEPAKPTEQKPHSQHQADSAMDNQDPALKEARLQDNAKKAETRARFAAEVKQIAACGEKVLDAHAKDIKLIETKIFEGSEKTYAIGTLEESPDKPWNPSIMVYAKDLSPEITEVAAVLTAVEVARIMNKAYGGDFARSIEVVNSGIRNNLPQEERLKLGEFFDIRSYENGSAVEIEEFQGGDNDGEMNYTWAYGLLRCKSGEILKKLENDNLSPALKEGVATVFLSALKVTANRLSDSIPPRDLGFNEDHIKKLAKIGGSKIALKYSS